ncbi:MAG: hypothetical protein LBM96_04940 [Methanobrevibacter sp.]|nr:hypothetical protein [Candidatus Methanoflexus mossambicus]
MDNHNIEKNSNLNHVEEDKDNQSENVTIKPVIKTSSFYDRYDYLKKKQDDE